MNQSQVAVLIPCYNESKTINKVIEDFKKQLPEASVFVYDNGSNDDSVQLAKSSGAKVKKVLIRGKGHVVRRMFADIEADLFILVDGDGTYDAEAIKTSIELLKEESLDMVICVRNPRDYNSFRKGHRLGNKLFNMAIQSLFGYRFKDVFSGYRVFSRRFVKSFPIVSQGFEIEAEMSIHALQLGLPFAEVETVYRERPPGSTSKLNTIRDGLKILRTILLLFIYNRPMAFFGFLFLIMILISVTLGLPIVTHFIQTGFVPRIPTALLAASFGILASMSLVCGILLDSVSRARLEAKLFWYLHTN